jgi:hypothetical protein
MTDYVKTTDFAAKDALASGNPNKLILGTQIDTEFENLESAIATKLDDDDTNIAKFDGVVSTDHSSSDEIGYAGIPQNLQTGNYTCVLTDANKMIAHMSGAGSGDTYTIPANSSVAFPIGTFITFVNNDSSNLSIAITSDIMYLAGTTTTGTRTLGQNGVATALKIASTTWIIQGSALS